MKSVFLIAALGVALLVIGAATYFARHPLQMGSWMIVTTVDEQGRAVGRSELVRIPPPDVVAKNGMSQVEPYVARLMASQARFASLLIFTADGQGGLGLDYENGQVSFGLNVDWRNEPEEEKAIRQLFARIGILPTEDYLAGNGGVPDATRILDYPVTGDVQQVAALCKRVLREIYGISDQERLDFSYQEHN